MGDGILEPGTIETLAATPAVLRALLGSLPQDAVEAPGAEGWSPRDVVAHLLSRHDDALVGRVRSLLEDDRPSVPDIPDETGMEALRGKPLAALLDEFAAKRAEALPWLRSLPHGQLTRTGRHEVAGTIAIADILHHLAYHDLMHVEQAARLVHTPIELRRGNMRSSFPDASNTV